MRFYTRYITFFVDFPFQCTIKFMYRLSICHLQSESIIDIFLVFNIYSKELMVLDLYLWYNSVNCIVSLLPLQLIVKPAFTLLRSSINITELLIISFCCWSSRAIRPIDGAASLYLFCYNITMFLFVFRV